MAGVKPYLYNSTLILIALASAFFPRVLDSAGFPAAVNFIHFAIVPFACCIVLCTVRTQKVGQVRFTKTLLTGLLVLLAVTIISALINRASAINAILQFLLLAEPFLLLAAVVAIPLTRTSLQQLTAWVSRFTFLHLLLALAQLILVKMGRLNQAGLGQSDSIQGVFYISGGGHVVAASVSTSFGLFYLVSAKTVPLWGRLLVLGATFFHLVVADAKQVMLVSFVSWGLLILLNLKDIRATLQYLVAAIVVAYSFVWCLQNVSFFAAFNTWIRPEIYAPDGEATLLKTASIRIILSYCTSPLNWFFGLGPGHTVGRLGGWMLRRYGDLLLPLGATIHPASGAAWDAIDQSWLGYQSSFFSPLFGWAGIWGDLGWVGLSVYLYLWFMVWCWLGRDNFSRFIVLTILVHGFIFTQLEEPGYMLFVAALLGLRWQQTNLEK